LVTGRTNHASTKGKKGTAKSASSRRTYEKTEPNLKGGKAHGWKGERGRGARGKTVVPTSTTSKDSGGEKARKKTSWREGRETPLQRDSPREESSLPPNNQATAQKPSKRKGGDSSRPVLDQEKKMAKERDSPGYARGAKKALRGDGIERAFPNRMQGRRQREQRRSKTVANSADVFWERPGWKSRGKICFKTWGWRLIRKKVRGRSQECAPKNPTASGQKKRDIDS